MPEAPHLPEPLPPDPFPIVAAWFAEARDRKVQPNPNSMTLATVNPDGRPSARIVLCKDLDVEAGSITFYTNYESRKGRSLDASSAAAAVFHWDALERQVRIEGRVSRTSARESDAYFATRPLESRIGAWVSDQSRPIASRAELQARLDSTMRRFGLDPARPPAPGARMDIPRPPHWGGYRLLADRVEVWTAGRGRLHDCGLWTRELNAATPGPWRATRVQP